MILLSTHLLVWALAKGEDVSYGAGWTDIPDAPPFHIPSGFSQGHLSPGVLGPGGGVSPESQCQADLRSHHLLHARDKDPEGQDYEVTPSPAVCW